MLKLKNYIDGRLVAPRSDRWIDNLDPATGIVYSLVPDSDEKDVDAAVDAAEAAFPAWSTAPAAERSRVLLKIADGIEAKLEEFSRAECIDSGKPLELARSLDIPRSISNFRFFATAVLHSRSESHATDDVALNYTLRRPRGVAGLISPWNLPLYLLSWKIAPALASGNTAVAKPSELTPATAFLLSKVCMEAGLPKGVLNIVHGSGAGAGAAIVGHGKVGAISFTGGTATGVDIASRAAPTLKKLSLELGGKNPNIVFADADLDAAVATSVRSSFLNQGQICLCGSRLFVEKKVYGRFLETFVAAAKKLKVGDPLTKGTDQGSLVSEAHLRKVEGYVNLAKQEGGEVLCGGETARLGGRCKEGFFFRPTVVTGLSVLSRVNMEEIFGPFVTVTPFEDEDQLVRFANATQYGLSASMWTRDLPRAHRLADRLQAGTVWVNCWMLRDLRVPFGGVKMSGVGREGGDEALRFFTEPKNVCIQVPSREAAGAGRGA
ncbi:MAG: aldehyde dehydrogenase [Elusimicrobia bacterium]|nr:aldehyde dehydrogenase [Elusimicrobiota bacterium]